MCYVIKSILFSSQVDESSPAIQSHPAKREESFYSHKIRTLNEENQHNLSLSSAAQPLMTLTVVLSACCAVIGRNPASLHLKE